MSGFGVRQVGTQGRLLRACSVPPPPYKTGGVTLDWATFPAVSGADKTLTDGRVVNIGDKYLRYGQCISRIGANSSFTLTVTATGGTYKLIVGVNGAATQTTGTIAFGANAATILAAIQALSNVADADVTVTGTGPWTITFVGALAQALIALTADNALATGGVATIGTVATGSLNPGLWGPYDPAAVDGRQNRTRGGLYIADETTVWLRDPRSDFAPGGVFDGAGAYVFKARVINNANDLTTNPSVAEMEAAFPGIRWTED